MDLHGISWHFMDLHGSSSNFMEFHGSSWNFMCCFVVVLRKWLLLLLSKLPTLASNAWSASSLMAQLQASMPSKSADYNKHFGIFAEFLDKFRNAVATAEKLSKTDLDEDKSLEKEKKISEWSCKATEHLDEITLLHKRARGWLA